MSEISILRYSLGKLWKISTEVNFEDYSLLSDDHYIYII